MTTPLSLPDVDQVQILTLVDQSLDLLMAGSDTVRRVDVTGTWGEGRATLRAEHGFSSMVTVINGNRTETFLFDAGMTKDGLLHNMDVLELRPRDLRRRPESCGKSEMAHSSGCEVNDQRAALPGGDRRNAPWATVPGSRVPRMRSRASRWAS